MSEMLLGAALAALGGLLWAFGSLGKRMGVEGATNDLKQIRATCTAFVYALTTLLIPSINFCVTPFDDLKRTFGNPEWTCRIPFILLCGVVSGFGNVFGALAFAYSAGENSALISMVENGTYTAAGALIIAVWNQEQPPPTHWIAGTLIMLGIISSQGSFGIRRRLGIGLGKSEPEDSEWACVESDFNGESDESEDSGSDTESLVSPPRLRKRAVAFAVAGGVCWGFGPLGKKHGVSDAPEGLDQAWTTSTYFIYMCCTNIPPIVAILFADGAKRRACFEDIRFLKLLLGVFVCWAIAGLGGLVSTYAFAKAEDFGAVISMIENGVYTVFGALLISLMYREAITLRQLMAAGLIVLGVCIAAV